MALSEEVRQSIDEMVRWIRSESESSKDASVMVREILDELTGRFAAEEPVDWIDAPNAIVEVIDRTTGRLYRRYLELGFHENDNGIQLIGEDLSGDPARIVFLSNLALEKIHELRGLGLDEPRCDH